MDPTRPWERDPGLEPVRKKHPVTEQEVAKAEECLRTLCRAVADAPLRDLSPSELTQICSGIEGYADWFDAARSGTTHGIWNSPKMLEQTMKPMMNKMDRGNTVLRRLREYMDQKETAA